MAWLPSAVTAEPAEEPVTLDELKSFLRVTDTSEDTAITLRGKAARHLVEDKTGLGLITQTRSIMAGSWDDLKLLPIGPVQSVTSVKYLDTDAVEQTLATSVYDVVSSPRRASIRLKANQTWPALFNSADAIRVVADVGFGAAADVPEKAKVAVMFLASQWQDIRIPVSVQRYPVVEVLDTVRALLFGISIIGF